MTTPSLYPAFAVPFAGADMPDAATLNPELRALLLERERQGGFANPNPSLAQHPGVFESDFTLFSWQDPCILRLRDFCWRMLGETIQQLNGYGANEMRRLQIFSHTWYHVTRHGGFTVTHTHPMASWSGVYCVDPGDTPPDRPESGVLRFHNPHGYSNLFRDAGNLQPAMPYQHGTWNIRFRAGQLVLFPSWIPHEVMPYYGGTERITIAFNTWFKM